MAKARMANLALLVCAMGVAGVSLAQGPAFDCAKARGEVEQAICADASLVALDRKLGEVYKAALAKAKASLPHNCAASSADGSRDATSAGRRMASPLDYGDVDGRHGEGLYRGPVPASYFRTAIGLAAAAAEDGFYACQNNPANEVVANFFETDPATIRLERGDRTVTLWEVGKPGAGNFEGRTSASCITATT
ncbi:MAG: hypothetical protein HT580_00615 [Dechloromonas sp.]|nr:MAG: hypothetical protein HT580_00615 [Dechloromonas sp.]